MSASIALFSVFSLGLIFCSAYFSCSETALFSLSSLQIRSYRTHSDTRKRQIAFLVQHPRDLLVTVFMLNTLVNILLQNVMSHMFGHFAGWQWKVGLPLILTLVFGEIIPKYYGLKNNIALSDRVAPTIAWFYHILRPIRCATIAITAPVSRLLFFFLKKEESLTSQEIKHVIETSQANGTVDSDEAELVRGYLDLEDTLVKELMRPKEDILYYDIHTPLKRLIDLFVDDECARIPVCERTLDNILGILYVKTFWLHSHSIRSGEDLQRYLSKPFYVPEGTLARSLLKQFDERREVLAMVVDEYGSVEGLITREDILEMVIGDIADKRDRQVLCSCFGDGELIANGKLELEELNRLLGAKLVSIHNQVTLGGWLTEQLGDIPKSGQTYTAQGLLFQVLAVTPRRIQSLYVRKLKGKADGEVLHG